MSNNCIGMGVMIHQMSGGNKNSPDKYYGKTITKASVDEAGVLLEFKDKSSIFLYDDGQSCCEDRYVTCDDDPNDLVGGILTKIEEKEYTEEDENYEVHEKCFIDISTNKATITITTHNVHNGYYGGFALTIRER